MAHGRVRQSLDDEPAEPRRKLAQRHQRDLLTSVERPPDQVVEHIGLVAQDVGNG